MYKASLLHMIGLFKGRHSLSTVRKALRYPLEKKLARSMGRGIRKEKRGDSEREREMSTIYIHTHSRHIESGY